MARRKAFSTRKAVAAEPIELEVNGTIFHCETAIPGMVLLDFVATVDLDNPAAAGSAIQGFFKTVIVDADYEAFEKYVRDPANDVDMETLSEMAGWLAEQYMGELPTVPAENA